MVPGLSPGDLEGQRRDRGEVGREARECPGRTKCPVSVVAVDSGNMKIEEWGPLFGGA